MKKLKTSPEVLTKCVPAGQEVIVKIWLDNVKTEGAYVCKTCKRHMEKGKMPPECRQNNLQLDPQPEVMKLTELSSNLIARIIQFQKIYQLPKSRYTALKDKVINVPVPEDSVLNTVKSLPRTPNEAGLIGVELKRKLVYSNTHQRAQMIDPNQIYKAMEYLKNAGNPYYQFYDDLNVYEERCVSRDDDRLIANALHDEEEDIIESLIEMPAVANPAPEDEIERVEADEQISEDETLRQEEEHKTKDPVRKYHFDYDQSLAMANMHPEATEKDTNQKVAPNMVSLAPAEGSTPLDMMFDKDWDVKSYPHLHQADGSNGLDQEREVKLTSQRYFVNRIIHKQQHFSKFSPYLYAAVAHTEKKNS